MSNMSDVEKVKAFHVKYNQDVSVPMTDALLDFRISLIKEEFNEFMKEVNKPIVSINVQNLTKELSDMKYVIDGFAVTFGLPLQEVYDRTHYSNMTKNGGIRADGKVLKGDGYEPPVLKDLFDTED